MAKLICVLLLFISAINCQTIKNVILVDYKPYFENFAHEFAKAMEEKLWSDLKMPDMKQDISSTIFGQTLSGTVKYTNGFVVSIKNLDIPTSNLAQKFVSPNDNSASAQVSGTIRMLDVTVGFDIEVDVNNKKTHYTGVTTYSVINSDFVISKDLFTNKITVTIKTSVSSNPTTMAYLPTDFLTDFLASTYVMTSTNSGIEAWGPVFQPVAEKIANDITFPDICYNCSLS